MLPSRYFRIRDDVNVAGRWYIADPVDASGRDLRGIFRVCKLANVVLPIRLKQSKYASAGEPLDYTELDGEIVPVVRSRVADLLRRLAPNDLQLLPVEVDGIREQFVIVNVVQERRCIDETLSQYVEKYAEQDRDVYPNLVGCYFSVVGLKIDKSKVENARVFRTWGWGAIIVSEEVKDVMESANVVGVQFEEV